ncbi:hypothetical protein GIB67_001093 [Kingdonia uniflora]|uniref:25S rRNA (uridine-N(3))-methyltransferase BMT5-like domain-containing protein n=1 Tax=Kingdonia uniflora TaxID=39325 RepID=A0A7J7MGF0_9MAGN|nr:hypothetical protein GIB67_001093 [Kingdonia uniflora]
MEGEKSIMHYTSSQKILTVGDGDFSFSACLAKAFVTASNLVATSLDSSGFLYKNYPNAESNIREISSRGETVKHAVDATTKADDYILGSMKFDRIVFNFPHVGFNDKLLREEQILLQQQIWVWRKSKLRLFPEYDLQVQ